MSFGKDDTQKSIVVGRLDGGLVDRSLDVHAGLELALEERLEAAAQSLHGIGVEQPGQVQEAAGAAPVALDEIWHLAKPASGQGGWVIAGIQQA